MFRESGSVTVLAALLSMGLASRGPVDVGNAVAELLGRAGDLDTVEIQQGIAGMGYDVLRPVFHALAHDELPIVGEEGERQFLPISPAESILLEATLELMPPHDVVDYLYERSREPMDGPERKLAVRLLGSVGSGRDVRLLVWLSTPADRGRIPRPDRVAFEHSLKGMLARLAASPSEVLEAYVEGPLDLAAHVVWATSHVDSPEAAELLARMFGEIPEVDALILAELARLGDVLPHPLPEHALAVVAGALATNDLESLLIAISAVSKVEATEAVGPLIELTEHEVRAVATAAAAALREITGIDRGAGPEGWREWSKPCPGVVAVGGVRPAAGHRVGDRAEGRSRADGSLEVEVLPAPTGSRRRSRPATERGVARRHDLQRPGASRVVVRPSITSRIRCGIRTVRSAWPQSPRFGASRARTTDWTSRPGRPRPAPGCGKADHPEHRPQP